MFLMCLEASIKSKQMNTPIHWHFTISDKRRSRSCLIILLVFRKEAVKTIDKVIIIKAKILAVIFVFILKYFLVFF